MKEAFADLNEAAANLPHKYADILYLKYAMKLDLSLIHILMRLHSPQASSDIEVALAIMLAKIPAPTAAPQHPQEPHTPPGTWEARS